MYWGILGYTGGILGYAGIYWDILGYTEIYWDILGCTGIYWDVLGYTEMYCDVLKYTTTGSLVLGSYFSPSSTCTHTGSHMQCQLRTNKL